MTQEDMSSVEGQQTTKGRRPHRMDGGYGWIVVIACFIVHMIQIGYIRAFGLLFVKFLDEFGAPVSYTSTVMGIQSAVVSITSLIVLSVILDYWTIRGYAMVGGAIGAIGVSISYFAMNVEFLILSQSILLGFGVGLSYGPGIVLLGRYFKRRLALANAIANAGVSFGGVTMPLLVSFLLEEYGLRGTLLIAGAVMSQVVVCAALYRNIESNSKDLEITVEEIPASKSTKNPKKLGDDPLDFSKNDYKKRERTLSNRSDTVHPVDPVKKNLLPIQHPDYDHEHLRKRTLSANISSSTVSLSRVYASNPNIAYTSIADLAHAERILSKEVLNTEESFCTKMKNILDVKFFKNPMFWVVAGFTPLCMCGCALGSAYLPALAQECGLSDQEGSLLLTISGAIDIVSRIVPGVLVEMRMCSGARLIIIGFTILGTFFQFTSYFTTFPLLIVFSGIYGLFGGVYFTLLSVVLIDLMGLDNFPKVFGFVMVFHGVSSVICFPILGALKDITGTYSTCFQFLGACMIVGSLVLCLEPLARKYKTGQEQRQVTKNNEYNEVPQFEVTISKNHTDGPLRKLQNGQEK